MNALASASIPYYTHPADDVSGVPAVDGVGNAAILFESHYESLLGTHYRDLAWKT
jgi:hypothetical protein